MKIARIETFLFDPGTAKNLLFCRVETEGGLHGWGEAYVTPGKEKPVADILAAMAGVVIGRSAFSIRHTAQVIFEDFAMRRASLELGSAWSAIEIALWDIVAKQAGMPLYNLLGGASRAAVKVYANGWSRGAESIEANVQRALAVKEAGYGALKWDPFPGPWRSFIHRED
ncbi:MAG TPA: mandelate racemase/muconate lactonizing enzyme family protein, partial [Acetobacteraceae bacterium]|nr:mandelate racemase/muconate lactonizing enzyme family protein [Acetobacteraceae bacterium]